MTSLLAVVDRVDNFGYDGANGQLFTLWAHDGAGKLGYVLEEVALELAGFTAVFTVNIETRAVHLDKSLDTIEKRTQALETVAIALRDGEKFDHTLGGWRDEKYTVYYPQGQPYVLLERAFCPLMGVVMYGVHINGYVPAAQSPTGEIQFWVPRRSATKPTFPGMLDNTIAGGMGYPYGVYETVVKESHEEAGIAREYVDQNISAAGVVSYIYVTPEGLVQPEVEYIFDLPFDTETKPFPVDHEAEEFYLMSLAEVLAHLRQGSFKPNCGLVMLDFLVRHGLLTAETEPALLEILQRSHRRLPFATK